MEITTIIVEVDISVGDELEVGVDVTINVAGGLVDEAEPGEGELESEAAANILWPTTRMDAIGITQGKVPLQVAIYNASPSKQVDALSRECYLVNEKLVVDIIVVNASQTAADLASAESTLEALQAMKLLALYTCKIQTMW